MFHGASSWSRNTSRFLFVLLPFMPMPCSISLPVLPHVSPTRLNSRLDGGGGRLCKCPSLLWPGRGAGKRSWPPRSPSETSDAGSRSAASAGGGKPARQLTGNPLRSRAGCSSPAAPSLRNAPSSAAAGRSSGLPTPRSR